MNPQISSYFLNILHFNSPDAYAQIKGAPEYPDLFGSIYFFQALNGTILMTQLLGLPQDRSDCSPRFLGLHIHEGSACSSTLKDPFEDAGMHLNPNNCPHPAHMGDLPPVLVNKGVSFSIVYSSYFNVSDILNHTIIIHSAPDDFTSQPSGNSGKKIGCGMIQPMSGPIDLI